MLDGKSDVLRVPGNKKNSDSTVPQERAEIKRWQSYNVVLCTLPLSLIRRKELKKKTEALEKPQLFRSSAFFGANASPQRRAFRQHSYRANVSRCINCTVPAVAGPVVSATQSTVGAALWRGVPLPSSARPHRYGCVGCTVDS